MKARVMPRIAVVDYGMGNLHSVRKALEVCGGAPALTRDPDEIRAAAALVVPGVGAFGDCVANLERLGLKGALMDFLASGKPYLGLCLGLQILFPASEESENRRGLGFFPGRVRRFTGTIKIPHMGWNTLRIMGEGNGRCPLFRGIANDTYVYFVHSYYPDPSENEIVAATTRHGAEFAAAVWRGTVMGTQFHPEKSQDAGLAMLRNFVGLVEGRG